MMEQYIFSTVCLMSGILCMSSCGGDKQAKPYTPDYEIIPEYANMDTWTAYEASNNNLLDPDKNICKTGTACTATTDHNNGATAIWCQPIYWDMTMSAYKRAKVKGDTERKNEYKRLCGDLFTGNEAHYVSFDFDDNNGNTGRFIYDDIQWWTITLARAYELFKVEEYCSLAEASSTHVWYGSPHVGDTGSYADPEKNLGGGAFQQWQPIGNPSENITGDGKMACINFPTVVAALTLYNNAPTDRVADPNPESWSSGYDDFTRPHCETEEAYLIKGEETYEWAVKNLVNSNTGEVADSKHGEDSPTWSDRIYNQATFIGASLLLYKAAGEKTYLDNAILRADYTVSTMSGAYDLLPFESGMEQGIYTVILAEYMAMLVNNYGRTQHAPFLKRNINCGWTNRDRTCNLYGGEYHKAQIKGATIGNYNASGIPALILLFPVDK